MRNFGCGRTLLDALDVRAIVHAALAADLNPADQKLGLSLK
jgi:hypothetical protein